MKNNINISSSASLGNQKGGKLDDETIMAYLEGRLTAEEQHKVEQWLDAEGMESDAIEGLKEVDIQDTKEIVKRLNQNLSKLTSNKKRKRRPLQSQQYAILAIAIILLLAMVAYIIIRKVV